MAPVLHILDARKESPSLATRLGRMIHEYQAVECGCGHIQAPRVLPPGGLILSHPPSTPGCRSGQCLRPPGTGSVSLILSIFLCRCPLQCLPLAFSILKTYKRHGTVSLHWTLHEFPPRLTFLLVSILGPQAKREISVGRWRHTG